MQLVGVFGRVAVAVPDGGGAAAGVLPGLHHKACLHPGDGQAVVIPRLGQPDEVGAGLGRLFGKQHRPEHPRRGVEHRHGVPRRRVGELQLRRFDVVGGGRAAPPPVRPPPPPRPGGGARGAPAGGGGGGAPPPPPALSAPPRHPARQSAIAKPKASRAFLHLPDIIFSLGHMLYHVHPIVFPADACRARPFDFQYTTEPAGARGRGCEKYKNRVLTVFPNLAS